MMMQNGFSTARQSNAAFLAGRHCNGRPFWSDTRFTKARRPLFLAEASPDKKRQVRNRQ
jgi:hypothetical protein